MWLNTFVLDASVLLSPQIQISQSWVFHVNKALHITVGRFPGVVPEGGACFRERSRNMTASAIAERLRHVQRATPQKLADVYIYLHLVTGQTCFELASCHIREDRFLLQGNVEGVKLSQCDFVAVEYGIFAERCLQLNVINSHINARCNCHRCLA